MAQSTIVILTANSGVCVVLQLTGWLAVCLMVVVDRWAPAVFLSLDTMSQIPDYYETLQTSRNATQEEILQAYRVKSLRQAHSSRDSSIILLLFTILHRIH